MLSAEVAGMDLAARDFSQGRRSMFRNLLIAALIWCACVADLGWATWTELRVAPEFLDLAVVVAYFSCRGRAFVFWSGVAGLLTAIVRAESAPLMILLFCSVGLIANWMQPAELKRATVTSSSFRSLLLLVVLSLGRSAVKQFPSTDFLFLIGIEQIAQLVFTFAVSILFCLAFVWFRRRHVWE